MYRLLRELSQTELADKVNIAQPQISYLERGIVRVSQHTLEDIAKKLEFPYPVEKLLEYVEL